MRTSAIIFGTIFLVMGSLCVQAQHYGGVYGTYYVGSSTYDHKIEGFELGYEGLLRRDKRIAFTYNLGYLNERSFPNGSGYPLTIDGTTYNNISLEKLHQGLMISGGVRFNIIKEGNLQPYVYTKINNKYFFRIDDITKSNGNEIRRYSEINPYWLARMPIGVGVNYKLKNFLIKAEGGVDFNNISSFTTVGLSITRKF